jgi:4-hydroxybenzoate polyprenyltransferase
VSRSDKPTVTGTIRVTVVRTAAFIAVAATVLLSVFLGPWAVAVNLVCVAGGWAYNLGLKSTAFSVVPYIVTFGLLPALATVAGPVPQAPAAWVIGVGALLGVAAHFTNVLPDLRDDSRTGIRGLPHRVGATASGIIAFSCLAASALLLALGPGLPPEPVLIVGLCAGVAIAVLGIVLTARHTTTRLLMRLIMAGALIDVVMLVLAGQSLTA